MKSLNIADVPSDLSGLIVFLNESVWQSVVPLATSLLNNEKQKEEWSTLQYYLSIAKFVGLFKMKQYDELVSEVISFLAATSTAREMPLHFSFPLQLLLCQVKTLTGRSHEASGQLLEMKSSLSFNDTGGTASAESNFWYWQLECHIINNYVRLRNWKHSIASMKRVIIALDGVIDQMSDEDTAKDYYVKSQIILLTRLSRILLQVYSSTRPPTTERSAFCNSILCIFEFFLCMLLGWLY